ncbi:MAG: rhomboid family intramembrane serine protease [Candidatus Cryptobacteroides sp.]
MDFYSNRGGFFSNVPKATGNLIVINALVMIMCALNGDFMYEKFSLFYPTSPFFKWWQPFTHLFMHGGFWHLFFNMFTLYMFGSALERQWGVKKFLLFYFVAGFGAALTHMAVQFVQVQLFMAQIADGSMQAVQSLHILKMTPTVGASGAIYGCLLAFAMLYPDAKMGLVFPPVVLKAKWMVLVFVVIELGTGLTGVGGNIAHFAHLGGMLFGWFLILYWKKRHTLYSNYDR